MKKFYIIITVVVLLMVTSSLSANATDVTIIVNKANTNTIDKATVKKIYMGDMTSWTDGSAILAIDLSEGNSARDSFTDSVLGKSVSNMKALWAQKIFSGKAVPPKTVESDDEVKKIVSGNKNAIGYIKGSSVDDSVKVVK